MLYHWYELSHAAFRPARVAAHSFNFLLSHPFNPLTHTPVGRGAAAALEMFERTTRRYDKPEFDIAATRINGKVVAVSEDIVWRRQFCNVVHFRRHIEGGRHRHDPAVLLVAPMSGHYASLLRGTIETLLPDHEVYITDWVDARMVPADAGSFDLDDYIDYMRELFRLFEGDVHVMAVCQPSVPVLAAVSLMEQDGEAHVPRSMILLGGPIDTRVSPTVPNDLAQEKGTDWFRKNVISIVPWTHPGVGRRVYPGFLQLTGFMTMNLDRHVSAHKELFLHLVEGDGDSAEKHREFYDEYLAVMDLTAEFYLQTVDTVFVRHALACGAMTHRGRRVDPSAVRRVALMTIEGELDDITGLGQCRAAHALCSRLPAWRKLHYQQPKVGHYGVFNGSRFRKEIAPRIASFIRRHDPLCAAAAAERAGEPIATVATASGFALPPQPASAWQSKRDRDAVRERWRVAEAGAPPSSEYLPGGYHVVPVRLFQTMGSLFLDGLARAHGLAPSERPVAAG